MSIRSCARRCGSTRWSEASSWSAWRTFPREPASVRPGAFTVGVLRAIYAYRREHVTAANLAQEACEIEIERLGRPVGKQDQYIAAFGGLTCMSFEPDGQVNVSPILVSNETLQNLEEHLCMFFTGYSRAADSVLIDQKVRSEQGDQDDAGEPPLRQGERPGHQGRTREEATCPSSPP